MLIIQDPDYKLIHTEQICEFHKKHPGQSYAGCCCISTYSMKKKTEYYAHK